MGSHFERVEVEAHCIKVYSQDTVTIVDAKERKIIKAENESAREMIAMVLENMDDAEAPLGINMIL